MFCFSPPFFGLLAELSLDKVCQNCICLNFLLSGKFAAPLWLPACNVLVCGRAGINQSELLFTRNFQGLNSGIADDPLDVILSVRGVVCSSKGYMSRLCWPVPAQYAQSLKKNMFMYWAWRKPLVSFLKYSLLSTFWFTLPYYRFVISIKSGNINYAVIWYCV